MSHSHVLPGSAAANAGSSLSPASSICSLERALAYQNANVVHGFMEKYAVSLQESEEIFAETKKFLWLIALALGRRRPTPAVTDQIMVIDEMWHTFVLFTDDYRAYCDATYGFYVDHAPTTRAERERAAEREAQDPAGSWQRWKEELGEQLSFIYDELGEEAVVLWYETYPRRYSLRRLEELRREQAERYIAARAG